MKDIEAMKERFLEEDVSVRLGELAVNLSRTKSRCQNAEGATIQPENLI
jgi:hypothetical protein